MISTIHRKREKSRDLMIENNEVQNQWGKKYAGSVDGDEEEDRGYAGI